ncbi:MAG: T9SS type A sorting domain-containing protein [Ignavibacteriales bacterium]
MAKNKILMSLFLLITVLFLSVQDQMIQAQTNPFTLKIEAVSPGSLGLNPATAQTWPVSSGLPVVAKGKKVYLSADTAGSGVTYSWALTQKPPSSNAVLDSTGSRGNSFTPDSTGSYTVSVTVGAKTLTQVIFVSTYRGLTLTQSCAPCHQTAKTKDKFSQWSTSSHATMYKRGITGNLAVSNGNGLYGSFCVKCHTTGWEPSKNNGNYGYLARITGWDTTWYKPAVYASDSTIRIPQGDSTRWVLLRTSYPTVERVANIGCEECHGPANDHANTADPTKVAVSLKAGVCNQCHDTPPRYQVGRLWALSNHATLPLSNIASPRKECYPCHSGAAFVKFAKNKANPGYDPATDTFPSISCATCHDPHISANTSIRVLTLDSLANGYVPASNPNFVGGKGLLCMNCHRGRENSLKRVTAQQTKFADRFYPHYNPAADMFLGANAYEYNLKVTGQGTHQSLPNACVTCHMAAIPDTTANPGRESWHLMAMTDDKGNDRTYVCKPCHPTVTTSFEDVKASSDYDGDGKIEGTQAEIQGLLDKLKTILPKDSTGEVVTMAADSQKVKSDPKYPKNLGPIWDYYFVKNDRSLGVHNAKYAVAILQASLGVLTGVEQVNNLIPATYLLAQNYPNPFNPVTTINFSAPENTNITLTVYDAVGREVAVLYRGELKAGNYKFPWNAGNLASGVYIYKITSDKFTDSKKMILLK